MKEGSTSPFSPVVLWVLSYLLLNGAETFLLAQGTHSQKKLQRAINLHLGLLLTASSLRVHYGALIT